MSSSYFYVSTPVVIVTCTPAMLRAGIVFGGVCLCICQQKISKTTGRKLMYLG